MSCLLPLFITEINQILKNKTTTALEYGMYAIQDNILHKFDTFYKVTESYSMLMTNQWQIWLNVITNTATSKWLVNQIGLDRKMSPCQKDNSFCLVYLKVETCHSKLVKVITFHFKSHYYKCNLVFATMREWERHLCTNFICCRYALFCNDVL